MKMKKGYFITIEGPEGSGKSTVIKKIENYLSKQKKPFISTREPGGVHIAEQIRAVILDNGNTKMDERTEALLYAAARRQHLIEKVIPAMNEGKIVLCDRFIHSSLAYQGYGRGIGMKEVLEMNQFAIDGYMPDLTILLDIEPELGLKRIEANKEREYNRLDKEKLSFHEMVRKAYLKMEEKNINMMKVDASQNENEVFEEVRAIIATYC